MSSKAPKILFHIQNKLSFNQLKMIFEKEQDKSNDLNYYIFSCEGVENLKNQQLQNWIKHHSNTFILNTQERKILGFKSNIEQIQMDKMIELIEKCDKIISF